MGLSLNPFDIIKFFTEKSRYEQESITHYMCTVAEEATALALIWQKIVEKIIDAEHCEVSHKTIDNILKAQVPLCNNRQYARLEEHYKSVSSILGEKYNNELNSVIYHIGALINKRNLTKGLVIDELTKIKKAKLYSDENSISDFNSLQESVVSLHKEAAALHVRAEKFKAMLGR